MKRIVIALALLTLAAPALAQDGPLLPSKAVDVREYTTGLPQRLHWGWAVVAALGPLADGISTKWGIEQSGPVARVVEGNVFYHKLFGSNVTANEILAFKVGQAALSAWLARRPFTHGDQKEKIIGGVLINVALHSTVSVLNVRNGLKVRRLNLQAGVRW